MFRNLLSRLALVAVLVASFGASSTALAGEIADKDFHFIRVNACDQYGGVTYIQNGVNQSDAVAWNCERSRTHTFNFLIEVCGAGPNTSATIGNVDLVALNRDAYCKGYPVLTAGIWYRHNPKLGDYCEPTADGLYSKMFLTATANGGVRPYTVVNKESGALSPSLGQTKACDVVRALPLA